MSGTRIPVKHGNGGNHPLQSLRDEIDHAFERFSRAWPHWSDWFCRKAPAADAQDWPAVFSARSGPDVNIAESESAYHITAELPGLDEKDIELLLSDGVLTLKGEKKAEREDKNKDYHLTERRFGTFRRSFALPVDIDEQHVAAKFSKGVLSVKLPKMAGAKQRRRTIKIATS